MSRKKSKFTKRKKPCAQKLQLVPVLGSNSDNLTTTVSVCDRGRDLGYAVSGKPGDGKVDFVIVNDKAGGVNARHAVLEDSGQWSVYVYGQKAAISTLPPILTSDEQRFTLIETLLSMKICSGNPDERFFGLSHETRSGYIHRSAATPTIRHNDCILLIISGDRCNKCMSFRNSLRATVSKQSRESGDKTSTSSRAPLSSLSDKEITQRYKNLKKRERSLSAKNIRLGSKLEDAITKQQVHVSEEVDTIIQEAANAKPESQEEPTLFDLFMRQQRRAHIGSKSGMRWHPLMIRWALGLKMKSTAAYRYLNKSGAMHLPSESTLIAYSRFRSADAGVDIDGLLELATKHPDGSDVALLADEVKIKDGLLYKDGKLSGFIDLDNIDKALEELVASNDSSPKVATHALAYMAQGLKQRINYPVAIYATRTASSSQMYHTFWECVRSLELTGFRVRAFVADGATSNRKMFTIHKTDFPEDIVTYHCLNKYADRPVYFISDVPHLVKTTRNCWENSGSHLKSRHLVLHGKPILWEHIRSIYNDTKAQNTYVTVHKLTHHHVNLTSYNRMSVRLAAQVMSSSVANAMQLKGDESLSSTMEFIRVIDKAFDCLNVRKLDEGNRTRNTNLNAYTSPDDERFEWLKTGFLGWLAAWEDDVKAQPNITAQDIDRCLLSRATRQGWTITINSFIALSKELLGEGYGYILSKKLVCQDIVEQFFARHRQSCGGNTAPTLHDMIQNTHLFRITKHVAIEQGSNCELADGHNNVLALKRRKY